MLQEQERIECVCECVQCSSITNYFLKLNEELDVHQASTTIKRDKRYHKKPPGKPTMHLLLYVTQD